MTGVLVSAATGAMGSLLGKLATMLTDKYKLFKGVRGDIEFLKKELEAMHVFLLRMAYVEEPDEQAKLRVDAIRNLSYDIEDSIDDFMLLVDRESDPDARGLEELFRRCKKKIKDINIRHKIAKEVKDIMSQVNEVSERYKRYQIGESSSKSKNEKVDPRVVAVFKNASELVGIDGPRDEIVKWLSMDSGESAHKQKVVSVVGYGGLGKTTLANQAYHNMGSSFDCRAFVSISREPDMTKILCSILSQISNGDVCAEVGDQQLIIGQIRKYLKDKRYFIVVDDIWDIPTWRILDCALFKNSCGSRVMTTTRKIDVAECCSLDEGLVYKIKPLSDADSKKLFFKRIFGCEEKCPDDLKEASKIIIRKCGGLPLAINAISSLLAGRQTKEDWIRVGNSIGSAQGKNTDIDAMNYILSLSYIDLPHYLRSCLLYLTLFPEDYEIERERLVHRWISEGFIHREDGQDLVELGDAYFHELVNRSLVQPVDIGYDGKARRCRVHDTILDFLISKSADENFCALLRGHSKITQDVIDGRVRRISLVGGSEDGGGVNISAKWNAPRIRSVGIFVDVKELPSFLNLSALRVLDAAECTGLTDGHVKDIARLYQLRYLNIQNAWNVSELPSKIGDLQYLETLVLSRSSKIVEIPTTITQLRRLVRLYIQNGVRFPDGIGKMKKLQVLEYIDIGKQSSNFLQGLGELASLKKLRIYWNVGFMEEDNTLVSCIEKLAPSLRKLEACSLRDLCVYLDLGENDGVLEDVSFPALSSIREITVDGQRICRFTKWLVSLANLEKLLCVVVKRLEQQDLEMVGRLPTLLEFTLVLGGNREVGPITVTGGGFQELRSFQFGRESAFDKSTQSKMKGLVFEAGAMPKGGVGPAVTFDPDAPVRERIFHFSRDAIRELKAMANRRSSAGQQDAEVYGKMAHDPKINPEVRGEISSFQSLCAQIWISTTRARKRLASDATTTLRLAVNCRHRLRPAVSPAYFGNAIQSAPTTATVAELASNDLRWAASRLNASLAAYGDGAIRGAVAAWQAAPRCFPLGNPDGAVVTMGSSNRFPMYEGNDFGWGRPLAVRSGRANKFDGKMSAFPGRAGDGSVDIEVCLAPDTMAALLRDEEFMQYVSCPSHLL